MGKEDEDNKSDTKSFVVKDKRRFDSKGDERGAGEDASREIGTKAGREEPSKKASSSSEASANADQEINFSAFVMSLATQALMQLGEMKAPAGVEIAVDPLAARQTIDILNMIQKKTKGNLEPGEESLLEEILHSLKMSYVKVS